MTDSFSNPSPSAPDPAEGGEPLWIAPDQPVAWLRDAHNGEDDECLVPAAEGDPGAFAVYAEPQTPRLSAEDREVIDRCVERGPVIHVRGQHEGYYLHSDVTHLLNLIARLCAGTNA